MSDKTPGTSLSNGSNSNDQIKTTKTYAEIESHIQIIAVELLSLDVMNFENDHSKERLLDFDTHQFSLLKIDIASLEKIRHELERYDDDYFELLKASNQFLHDGKHDVDDEKMLDGYIDKLKEKIKEQMRLVDSKLLEFGTAELKCMYSFVFNFCVFSRFGLDFAMQYFGSLKEVSSLTNYTTKINDVVDVEKNKEMLNILLGIYRQIEVQAVGGANIDGGISIAGKKDDSDLERDSRYVESTPEQEIASELYGHTSLFKEKMDLPKDMYTDKCDELISMLKKINLYYKK